MSSSLSLSFPALKGGVSLYFFIWPAGGGLIIIQPAIVIDNPVNVVPAHLFIVSVSAAIFQAGLSILPLHMGF